MTRQCMICKLTDDDVRFRKTMRDMCISCMIFENREARLKAKRNNFK